MADPFADAADYFGDDAAPTPPLSPRPALFPAPSAEEARWFFKEPAWCSITSRGWPAAGVRGGGKFVGEG